MTGLDRDTSKSPDRTGVCCTGRCAPSQCETITGPSFHKPCSYTTRRDTIRLPANRVLQQSIIYSDDRLADLRKK